jgi:hypothetical protein
LDWEGCWTNRFESFSSKIVPLLLSLFKESTLYDRKREEWVVDEEKRGNCKELYGINWKWVCFSWLIECENTEGVFK